MLVGNKTELERQIQEKQALIAHEFLQKFLNAYHEYPRGGVHDLIEGTIAMMVNKAIMALDNYLESGHSAVDQKQIMTIIADVFQGVLDQYKKSLDKIKEENFH